MVVESESGEHPVAIAFSSKTIIDKLKFWEKKHFTVPFFMSETCCGQEISQSMELSEDFSRLFAENNYSSPEVADVLIISSAITISMSKKILKIYNQMDGPKWVVAFGACSIFGGPFEGSYNIKNGINDIIPVDVFIPGCPPSPEAIAKGMQLLKQRINAGVCAYLKDVVK